LRGAAVLFAAAMILALAPMPAPAGEPPQQYQLESRDLETPFYNPDTKQLEWKLAAGWAGQVAPGVLEATAVKIDLYRPDGEVQIRAPRGRIDDPAKKAQLSGTVMIFSKGPDAMTLVTDHLDWDTDKRVATSDAPVTISRPDFLMQGVGFVSSFADAADGGAATPQTLTVLKQVTMTLKGKLAEQGGISIAPRPGGPSPDVIVRSDGKAVLDNEAGTLTFHDNVLAVQSDMRIHARTMTLSGLKPAQKEVGDK
jgi:LPS export ABC transporter protein LptC